MEFRELELSHERIITCVKSSMLQIANIINLSKTSYVLCHFEKDMIKGHILTYILISRTFWHVLIQ